MAEMIYYCGTMDSGKSTLALQTAHNRKSRGLEGLILTNRDRGGTGVITSRLGLQSAAHEVSPDFDIYEYIKSERASGRKIEYVICDETQFLNANILSSWLASWMRWASMYLLLEFSQIFEPSCFPVLSD